MLVMSISAYWIGFGLFVAMAIWAYIQESKWKQEASRAFKNNEKLTEAFRSYHQSLIKMARAYIALTEAIKDDDEKTKKKGALKMEFFEAFNGFHVWSTTNSMTPNQRSLFFALVQFWNAAGCPDELSVSEGSLKELSGIGNKSTFYNTRTSLEQLGLVKVSKSMSTKKAAKYRLIYIGPKKATNFIPKMDQKQDHFRTNLGTHSIPKSGPYTDKTRQDEKRKEKSSSSYARVSEIYQANFGILNPLVAEELRQDIEEAGEGLLCEAMRRAAMAGKAYRYAQGILRSWEKACVKTVADAQAEAVGFENRQKQSEKVTQRRKGGYI